MTLHCLAEGKQKQRKLNQVDAVRRETGGEAMTGTKVLVVDDSAVNRAVLRRIIEDMQLGVVEAANGAEAIVAIRNVSKIEMIILDIVMPILDGYDVLKEMHIDPKLKDIPIMVATSYDDDEAQIKAFDLGAVDVIGKPYNPRTIQARVRNIIDKRQSQRLAAESKELKLRLEQQEQTIRMMEIDALTGLYTRDAFIKRSSGLISRKPSGYYVLTSFDIDSFKVINDQFGAEIGDKILLYIAYMLKEFTDGCGGISCHLSYDNFAALFPMDKDSEIGKISKNLAESLAVDGINVSASISAGRYVVADCDLPVSAMMDRALLAKRSIKGRYDAHVAYYDDSMRDMALREQWVVNEMESALRSDQFEVWFQPQYNHSTGAMVGAEALVRWRHPQNGLVSPGIFIPIFERNGFIYLLDQYVWEKTCAKVRAWLDEGREPLPVSVNVSRYDMFKLDFFEVMTGLVEKYDVPLDLFRLEITESAFAKSTEHIIEMVQRLRDYGFIIEIDDFGSGYSSFNTLKDVPANILKLDMRFLEGTRNSERGGSILESIVRMAKWLSMPVIAEGVETKEQADYLRSIGCVHIQGYLYAKPMPAAEYEDRLNNSAKEHRFAGLETIERLNSNAFWDPRSIETMVFNRYAGGACVFEYFNDEIEILRVNEKYASAFNSMQPENEIFKTDLLSMLSDDDRCVFISSVKSALESGNAETFEVVCDANCDKSHKEFIRFTIRMIAHNGERYLFYAYIENMTAQRQAEHQAKKASEQLQEIMDNVSGGVTAFVIDDDKPRFIFANNQYYEQLGYTREQFDSEVNSAFDLVHPEERSRVMWMTKNASITKLPFSCVYRAIKRDGSIIWLQCNVSIANFPDVAEPVQLAVASDISAQRMAEKKAYETAAQMQAIINNVNGGVSAAIWANGVVDYIFVNDQYYAMYGYTKEQFKKENPRGITDIIHPMDLQSAISATEASAKSGEAFCVEYRVKKRDGSLVWIRSSGSCCYLSGFDAPVQIAVSTDITSEKASKLRILETSAQLRFLNDISRDLLGEMNPEDAIQEVLGKVLEYFNGSRAYVFEFDWDNSVTDNTYEVCAAGIKSEKNSLQGVPNDTITFWLKEFAKHGHIHIPDVDTLDESRSEERRVLADQNIRSLVAVPLRRDGRLIGFMGVDDPSQNDSYVGQLEALGDYMAVILTRRDLNATVENDNAMLLKLMNDMPGGFARMKAMPDGTLKLLFVNAGICRMLGTTRQEVMCKHEYDMFRGVHPDDRGYVEAAFKAALKNGRLDSIKYRLKNKSGVYTWVIIYGSVTKNHLGESFYNVYYADATEQMERHDVRGSAKSATGAF